MEFSPDADAVIATRHVWGILPFFNSAEKNNELANHTHPLQKILKVANFVRVRWHLKPLVSGLKPTRSADAETPQKGFEEYEHGLIKSLR